MRRRIVALLLVTLTTVTVWVAVGQDRQERDRSPVILDRAPVRAVKDPYPAFSGIDMDVKRAELFVADENLSAINVYRTEFSPHDRLHEPLRRLRGAKARLGFACDVAVSPDYGEIFTISGEGSTVRAFPIDANGDVAASRVLDVEHGTKGIALDRNNDELFVTVQHINAVFVHRRSAMGSEGTDKGSSDYPVRFIQGPKTGLADPQDIFADPDHEELFVTNLGNWQHFEPGERYRRYGNGILPGLLKPSSGKFLPPSVTVYARTAHGDAAPLRIIQGSQTGLNLPLGISLDPISDQLVVANSGDSTLLFFPRKADGNMAPVRILKGLSTGLAGPTGIFVDTIRNELWVSNWDNHTATVYSLTAQGNVAPLRTIRGGPKGSVALGFGNISDLDYDPKREEILVPD